MLIVHVFVQVHSGREEEFRLATMENARHSLLEPGIARFDVVQDLSDPTRFVLVEAYRDDLAPAAHKETAHYKAWREAVEPWMAVPRLSSKYREIHPEAEAW
jgi:quinol monooxygenase YgiN